MLSLLHAHRWIAPLVALGFLVPLHAAAPVTWNLEALEARALAENPELKFYEAEVAAAKGQRRQAGLWKNPELSGEYGSRKDGPNDGFTRSFSLTQTFEFPGKGSLRKAIANQNIALAELGLQQFRQVLKGKVRGLSLEYVLASDNAEAAAEVSERSRALIRLLQDRPLAGTASLLELRVIESNLFVLQKAAKDFVQTREEARIELNTLVGLPAHQPLTIQTLPALPNAKRIGLNELILRGLNRNAPLKMRTLELEKAVKEVSAAKLDIAPDFSVGPFFSQDKAGGSEENIGASLSLTLPLWNANQGNIATAKARQAQADALLLDARRRVEAQIARSHRAFELNRKLLEQFPDSTVQTLREASDLADRNYRTGAVGVQLFLEMQRGYLDAQQARNAALLEAWKHWLDLELLTGGENLGGENSEVRILKSEAGSGRK